MGRNRKFYPLRPNPGIQLDGSENESQSCIEGNWFRFQRGYAQTMGGITAGDLTYFQNGDGTNHNFAGNYLTGMQAFSWNGYSYLFVGYTYYIPEQTTGNVVGFYIFQYQLNGDLNQSFRLTPIIQWKTADVELDTDLSNTYFLFSGPFSFTGGNEDLSPATQQRMLGGDYFYAHLVHDSTDILNNSPSQLYLLSFDQTGLNQELTPDYDVFQTKIEENIYQAKYPNFNFNGGVAVQQDLYVAFGNGYYVYSTWPDFREFILTEYDGINQTTLDFINPNYEPVSTVESLAGSNQKIIKGAFTRGGGNAPTLLFWSLSSLTRVLNISGDSTNIEFRADLVSDNCSLMNRDCVVELDGLFYWIGIDRFFVYNGTVQEVPNTFNQIYFFNNVDLTQRTNIVAAVNARYGEIWWFYPDKNYVPYSIDQDGNIMTFNGNTAAIVYNKRDNCWYNVPNINRDAASFSPEDGFFFTGGCDNFTQEDAPPEDYDFTKNYSQIYIHDTPTMKKKTLVVGSQGQTVMEMQPIYAFLQMPFVSWKFMSPDGQMTGTNRQINLVSIEPDFQFADSNITEPFWSQTELYFTISVQAKKFLLNNPYTCNEQRIVNANTSQVTFSTTSNSYLSVGIGTDIPFTLATFLLEFEVDGEK